MASYALKSGYEHFKILNRQRPIPDVIADPETPDDIRTKLQIALEAREYAENNLGFKKTDNYTTYVELNRPYVTWILTKAHRNRLEYELFKFPIVGSVPYKGYFSQKEALEAESEVDSKLYDTWVRGASAYSTLGWFQDPVLSTMLRGDPSDVVELILHESAHATLYIESSADFNEQLATFLGEEASIRFFHHKEGADSPTVSKIQLEQKDRQLFSLFLKNEVQALKTWYESQSQAPSKELRQAQFKLIQTRFQQQVLPKLRTDSYKHFSKYKLNNAIILGLGTYLEDLDLFDQLLQRQQGHLQNFIEKCREFSKTPNPSEALKHYLAPNSSRPSSPDEDSP